MEVMTVHSSESDDCTWQWFTTNAEVLTLPCPESTIRQCQPLMKLIVRCDDGLQPTWLEKRPIMEDRPFCRS